jgi:hypothetical protein
MAWLRQAYVAKVDLVIASHALLFRVRSLVVAQGINPPFCLSRTGRKPRRYGRVLARRQRCAGELRHGMIRIEFANR